MIKGVIVCKRRLAMEKNTFSTGGNTDILLQVVRDKLENVHFLAGKSLVSVFNTATTEKEMTVPLSFSFTGLHFKFYENLDRRH